MLITNFTPEEFLKVSHEPYFSNRSSTNLLSTMLSDETIRQQTCKSFIESLKTHGKKIIKTEFHLNWAMECLGYSFSLPSNDIPTISVALSIYKDWFTQNPNTPEIFKQNLTHNQREILGHISLVFIKKEDLHKHEKICNEIISFLKLIIKMQLHQSIWESLLYMLMITYDQLVKKNLKLAEILSSSILKVLFEAWIRAKSHNKDLWNMLKKKICAWIDCKSVINHWASVTLSLTKTMTSMLYGEHFKEIEIVFDPGSSYSEILRIMLTDEEKVYFWYRFTELVIGETKGSAKMNPEIHSALAGSVSSIVNYFLSICSRLVETGPKVQKAVPSVANKALQRLLNEFMAIQKMYFEGKCRLPIPSINSLMDVYGNWLFFHSNIDPTYDSFGKSETLSILCKIFSFAQGPASSNYSATFFTILLSNISDGDKFVVGEIIKNSTEIVTYGIDAIDFLLRPDGFIQHLAIYLCDKETEKTLKSPCYSILASISVLPNVYCIRQISKNIVDIFVPALGIEDKNRNFTVLVWSMCAFAGTLNDDQDSLQRIICAMFDRLEKIEYRDKEVGKFRDLVEVITVLPYLINKRLVAAQIIKRSFEKLLSVIPKRGKSVDSFQTTSVLLAINSWINCFPIALTNPDIRFEFLKSLENRKKQYKSEVLYIEGKLFNTLERNLRYESGINLANVIPKTVPNSLKTHFCFGDTVWSFYQRDSEVGVVIRNPSGLFGWKIKLVLQVSKEKLALAMPVSQICSKKTQKSSEGVEKHLKNSLSSHEKKIFEKLRNRFDTQQDRISNTSIVPKATQKEIPVGENYLKANRMLITQLGLLDSETRKHLNPMTGEEFEDLIYDLDALGEKEIIAFPIIYLENPETKPSSIFKKHKKYSQEFIQFVRSLGMVLTASTNFSHFWPYIKDYEQVVYKNFKLFESFVYFPEFLQHTDGLTFKEYLNKNSVVVVWNQKMHDLHSKKKVNVLNDIDLNTTTVIILNVVSCKLTRVNVEGKLKKQGPLVNQMVVPNDMLGKLLNFTVYGYRSSLETKESLWEKRKEVLKHNITEKNDLETLLNCLFN